MLVFAIANLIYCIILCYLKPYKDRRTNILRCISEPLFTIGTILISITALLKESLNAYDLSNMGWLITFIFLLATIMEVCTLFSKEI